MTHAHRVLHSGLLAAAALCALAWLGACGDDGATDAADNSATNGSTSTNGGNTSNTNGLDVPAEFASLTNPKAGDAAAASAGEATFSAQCASCHGDSGAGDGPIGASLSPPATNLTDPAFQATSDGYIYYRLDAGGAPLNSSMPAYGASLSEDQLWELVTYIRTLGS